MIKAVLVDDEILVLNLLQKIIRESAEMQVLAAFTDPEQALEEIPGLRADVVFLDVDMPEMNGIELATKLIEHHPGNDLSIVFVTAYEQYAIRAFELNAIHYILKPVDLQSVNEILERVCQKKGVERKKETDNASKAGGEIYLFGNLHLRIDGSTLNFLTPKIEELLALLLLHRETGISKWSIIDVLWEESSIEKSQQNLYTMIFRLKQTLRNAGIQLEIKRKNSMYHIELPNVYCDVLEFDRLVKKGLTAQERTIETLEHAIALYQGELLKGKDYLWCLSVRERYYLHYVELVNAAAGYYVAHQAANKLRKLAQAVKPLLHEDDYSALKLK
ncbi:response regulator [Paenibacillus sp. IB182496]|uniref:Response regulator n=1 Tax=Paenibacillus sabuli TaxID=2772509 RepID=A0A927BTB1_9BACL|nr:response regulator [Paenibacillus sabuli]MBD2846403.1 response regulator [Paenibacillus sabuli]